MPPKLEEKLDDPDGLTVGERAIANAFLEDEPTTPLVKRESTRAEVLELLDLFAQFETQFNVSELYAITHISAEDLAIFQRGEPLPIHPLRTPAKLALGPIAKKWSEIKDDTTISGDKLEELRGRYQHISRAVGLFQTKDGIIDHTR